jgi:hypothetical protein
MKIRCDNGLCDRLRFIFSYYSKLKINEKIIVCWKINKKCNGHFLDLFEPINNLEFTEEDSGVDIYGWKPAYFDKKENIYKDLILLPDIEERVRELKIKMGKYVSVQIRRTDKAANPGLAQKFTNLTSDDCFINFLKNNKQYNIFLATDCFYVQNKFKDIFKEKIYWNEKIKEPWNFSIQDCQTKIEQPSDSFFRPTSLKSAAVDLFTCINSYKFMGTNLSGMSKFIDYNRFFKFYKIFF